MNQVYDIYCILDENIRRHNINLILMANITLFKHFKATLNGLILLQTEVTQLSLEKVLSTNTIKNLTLLSTEMYLLTFMKTRSTGLV